MVLCNYKHVTAVDVKRVYDVYDIYLVHVSALTCTNTQTLCQCFPLSAGFSVRKCFYASISTRWWKLIV